MISERWACRVIGLRQRIRGDRVFDVSLRAQGCCAAPAYLAQYGTPRSPDDLAQHRAVNFFSAKTGRVFDFEFARDGRALQIGLAHQIAANDADTQVALALAGLGIVQCPRTRIVAEHISAGRLLPILTEWSAGSLPLVAMYPHNRHLNARVRAFVDWVIELYLATFEQVGGVANDH